ncbi:MAG: enoyl-CoA hydratase/isomerase family protein [Myxococcales bacterium]|nr:enoyl-CoA hydratase/isomerase family protein [Myxococcales bacterium]HIK86077.1 enoyl-CoA hydratase/isomerase family protein [Myxococcales bacterium]
MQDGSFTGFEVVVHPPGIAEIRFNRPERLNGMTHSLKRDLIETLVQVQMDDGVRVVLFTGTGRAFSAGDDLKGYVTAEAEENARVPPLPAGHATPIGTYDGLRTVSQQVNLTIRNLDKLSVAAIGGLAIQTGFSLTLACDFRIASESARMGSATLRFGLLPDEGGQFLLVQHLGVAKTMDFLMRKKIIGASEALELGLVHEVVPDSDLPARALELAIELANGPQVSMRLLKRSIYSAAQLTFEQSLDEIAAKTAISDHHPDAKEGGAAFREKREAKFNRWLDR